MAKSDYVFIRGDAMRTGFHGETDYAFESGNPIPNTGQSNFIFESGIGLGGTGLPEDFEWAGPLEDWYSGRTDDFNIQTENVLEGDYTLAGGVGSGTNIEVTHDQIELDPDTTYEFTISVAGDDSTNNATLRMGDIRAGINLGSPRRDVSNGEIFVTADGGRTNNETPDIAGGGEYTGELFVDSSNGNVVLSMAGESVSTTVFNPDQSRTLGFGCGASTAYFDNVRVAPGD